MAHVRLVSSFASLTLLGALAACSSTTGTADPPAPGPTTAPTGTTAYGTTEPPPDTGGPAAYTEAEVQALFDARCVRCHGSSNDLLSLEKPFTKETVGVPTGGGAGRCSKSAYRTRIVPGDRSASLLFHKVKGTHDCGSPMPYDRGNPPLDATELERLGLYIDQLR